MRGSIFLSGFLSDFFSGFRGGNRRSMRVARFAGYVWARFQKDQCLSVASALTLTSLLSIVPLMAVVLAAFSIFPEFNRMGTLISDFVFRNFVPSFGRTIQTHLMEFVSQARSLQFFGIAFLLATALKLMSTIDKALNAIWGAARKRNWARGFVLYWAFLTLGPILAGLSVGLTSYFASLPVISDAARQAEPLISMILPFALTWAALSLLYMAVPNRKVPLAHALAGGALGAVFFELGKRLFTLYIAWFPNFKIIFGAMTSVPLFMLWVYISWVFVLLGAEIARGFSAFPAALKREGRGGDFADALAVLEIFHHHYRLGRPLFLKDILAALPGLSESRARGILFHFLKAGVVGRLSRGGLVLIAALGELTLARFHRMMPWSLPREKIEGLAPEFADVFTRSARETDRILSIPLERLFQDPGAEEREREKT
ncbi:conserved membrane hypothetical protein [Candidatus Desulfarcum epimagneticum]|uniref:UPF0761 membrane protein EPICR_110045 n=1 Tax=uncultured Desulfobacteraceae bacterium TaxID=218296 RepID=A0A484HF64_9BACT|nr:conserved membrane hypothetical protein [uncultured Desulfobacteraceae bacterium]